MCKDTSPASSGLTAVSGPLARQALAAKLRDEHKKKKTSF
jgi:hypothetical protein